MNENGRKPTLQEPVERNREQKQKERELVAAMFREAVRREREQPALVEQVRCQAIDPAQPPPPNEPPTVHYTELPTGGPNSPIAGEWNLYRREVGRLLGEGHENRWVLIKGEHIIGIWDTEEEARAVALHTYLMQPCLIHQVRSREPVVRMSARFWGCQG